jgi:hypothetical protein
MIISVRSYYLRRQVIDEAQSLHKQNLWQDLYEINKDNISIRIAYIDFCTERANTKIMARRSVNKK